MRRLFGFAVSAAIVVATRSAALAATVAEDDFQTPTPVEGQSLDLRTMTSGGSWAEFNNPWVVHDYGVTSSTKAKSCPACIGWTIFDANVATHYRVVAKVTLSPTSNRAAPGITANFRSPNDNLFVKVENTSGAHSGGGLILGTTRNDRSPKIASGPGLCGSGGACFVSSIGVMEGQTVWLTLARTASVVTASVYHEADAVLASPIATVSYKLTATDLARFGSHDGTGLRTKTWSGTGPEDNGGSIHRSIRVEAS